MLNPVSVMHKIANREHTVSYALGRFKSVRMGYSRLRNFQQRNAISKKAVLKETLFPFTIADKAHQKLSEEGVFLGLKLPEDITHEIKQYALSTKLTQEDQSPPFRYYDVKNGYLPDGRPVPQAIAANPFECRAIQRIMHDPNLMAMIERYLNYSPTNALPILKWSFVLDLPDAERISRLQTVKYHYDVQGFNFVYANFYLLDTDKTSGAHIMFKSSHNKKSLGMLLNSAIQPEANLYRYYGKENELVIEGKAGSGFLQDPACYHKALKPTQKERLFLQIRYW